MCVTCTDRIGEYNISSGTTVNSALVTGLTDVQGIALLDSNLFITQRSGGIIGEYTTSGATVNASLVTGLSSPYGIAVTNGIVPPIPSPSSTPSAMAA